MVNILKLIEFCVLHGVYEVGKSYTGLHEKPQHIFESGQQLLKMEFGTYVFRGQQIEIGEIVDDKPLFVATQLFSNCPILYSFFPIFNLVL